VGLAIVSFEKLAFCLDQPATQHVRVSLVVQNLRRFSNESNRLLISAIRKVKTANSIITRSQPNPGRRVFGSLCHRIFEIFRRYTEMSAIEMLQRQF